MQSQHTPTYKTAFYSAVLTGGLLLGSVTTVLFRGFGGIWDWAGTIASGGFVVVFILIDLLFFQRWAKAEALTNANQSIQPNS